MNTRYISYGCDMLSVCNVDELSIVAVSLPWMKYFQVCCFLTERSRTYFYWVICIGRYNWSSILDPALCLLYQSISCLIVPINPYFSWISLVGYLPAFGSKTHCFNTMSTSLSDLSGISICWRDELVISSWSMCVELYIHHISMLRFEWT